MKFLNLSKCGSLSWLPDLSKARSLEELDLRGSGIQLREEDMCMLAALPLLHPVLVGCEFYGKEGPHPSLDVVRRMVLHQETGIGGETRKQWTELYERDLGMLPVRAKSICES